MAARQQITEEIDGPRLGLKHLWVLNLLAHYGDRALSLAEIARGLGVKERSIAAAVDDLQRLGMVRRSTGRNGPQFTLHVTNSWTRQVRAILNRVYLDPLLDELSDISHKVILFGGAAYGGEDAEQTLNLLIVTTAGDRQKVWRVLEAHPLARRGRLRPTVVDGEELAMLPQRDRNLYDQVSRGMVLWER